MQKKLSVDAVRSKVGTAQKLQRLKEHINDLSITG